MNKRKILIISDSHLTEHGEGNAVFHSLLKKISTSSYDVLFLGDIFDVWIGCPGYETQIHHEFMAWCREEVTKRRIWFVEGNHEFFIFRNRSSCFTEVFPQSCVLDDGTLYAAHGDLVNYHDHAFTFLRALLRNPATYVLLRLFGLTGWGYRFSGKVRKDLKGTNQKQKHYFPSRELHELDEILGDCGIKTGVLGHFHRSGQEGRLCLLNQFTGPDYEVGIYESGKGIRRVRLSELPEVLE